MSKNTKILLMVIAALITIIGFVTGKFLFLFIWLPLGFLFKKKEKED
ncbi:MAG TPA: hypothetical protein PKH16_03815 [Aequorivita sp.]|jgi:hypothetical protein|nr:hypothetical protein [Aequorivita sp.]|tara:strand:+ start:27552 stop:27692 length:141 start_codon:yes stop_codon:yes gene_type:complete